MMPRRCLLTLSAAAAVALALAGCAPTASTDAAATNHAVTDASGTATVFISGDTNVQSLWTDAIIPAFEKANPGASVTTTLDLHGEHDAQTMAKLTSSVQAKEDPGFDLIDSGFIQAAGKAGLLEDVSADNIPNLATVPDTTVKAGAGFGIPYRASSVLLAYDSTKVKTPPATLDELLKWITTNPGQFTYNSPSTGGSGAAFVTTVLDKYVSDASRTTMTTGYDQSLEGEWDKGFDELKSLNSSMYQQGVYPNGNNQVLDLLGTGAIEMAPVWSDQVITAQKTGTLPSNIKYAQISNPSFTGSASYLGIPKTAAHKDVAQKLADYVLSSEGQALIASTIAGYPVVSLDSVPSELKDQFAAADPSTLRPTYYSQMASDMNNLWDAKVPGQ
ncbi:polyamine ABC transporter substrate-binding protein [Agreia bicolorata]|uniref:Polyamine ABC transporter substrate-binding protein n=2 Tax=Agreia bicolorata TaxID=110935 RepID=A0ABR5CFH7_9MICO|nr:polyamine ABC transporter substrate-binding protein [Agreia bicolorata]